MEPDPGHAGVGKRDRITPVRIFLPYPDFVPQYSHKFLGGMTDGYPSHGYGEHYAGRSGNLRPDSRLTQALPQWRAFPGIAHPLAGDSAERLPEA